LEPKTKQVDLETLRTGEFAVNYNSTFLMPTKFELALTSILTIDPRGLSSAKTITICFEDKQLLDTWKA